MKERLNDAKEILKEYSGDLNKRYLYRDKNFDTRGINYKKFIKFRYCIFNPEPNKKYDDKKYKETIIYKIGIVSWRVLCYLIINSQNQEFIKITPNIIMQDLQLSKYDVFQSLESLNTYNLIHNEFTKGKSKNINEYLKIIILYTNDDNYKKDKGYKAIPYEFIQRTIYTLNSYEWSILSYLMILHRYCKVDKAVNDETGEVNYYCNEYMYSFPSQDYMSSLLKIDKRKLAESCESLQDKKHIKIAKEPDKTKKKSYAEIEGEKPIIRNANNMYYITLFNKYEYMKYHVIDVPYINSYTEKEIRIIEKNTIQYLLENYPHLISDKKYISATYKGECENYKDEYIKREEEK